MKKIHEYITKRYERWLDYASYHTSLAGIPDEAVDVLNEVLLSCLQKPQDQLIKLLESKKGGYTELDFYILQSIKLNAQSDTAPYRAKNKTVHVDDNVNWQTLDIEDVENDNGETSEEYVYRRMNDLRQLIEDMFFCNQAMAIFEFKYFHDGDFKDWPGPESVKELYTIYAEIRKTIKKKYNGEIMF